MAIVATFSADFTKWNEGLRNAQAGLKPIEVSAKGLQRQLEQTAKAFSGANIRREAEIAAAAVKAVGGAVKLTADEIKRYGTTIDTAIEKSRRLGEGISPALKEAKRDLETAKKGLVDFGNAGTGLKSIFSGLGGTIAGAFAIGSILSAAKATLNYASSIKDLSQQTHFGVEALQELKFAADQNGVSMEAIGSAAFNLQKRIGEGGSGTVGALRKLGLTIQDLKNLKPEEQFTLVATKLGDVKDATEQATIGADLLGKGFKEVAPLINDGLQQNIDKAREFGVVLSKETIDKLDELGDTMAALQLKGKSVLAELLVPLSPALIAAADGAINFGRYLSQLQTYFTEAVVAGIRFRGILKFVEADLLEISQQQNPFAAITGAFTARIAELRQEGRDLGQQAKFIVEDLRKDLDASTRALIARAKHANEEIRVVADVAVSSASGFGAMSQAIRDAQKELAALKPGRLTELRKAVESGAFSMEDLRAQTGLSETALKLFTKQVQQTEGAAKKSAEANKKQAESIRSLAEEISGAGLLADLRELEAAWNSLTPAQQQQAIQVGRVVEKYQALASKLPTLPPDLRSFAVAMNEAAIMTGRMSLQVGELKPLIDGLGPTLDKSGQAFRDWGAEVGFERGTPIIPFYKSLGEVISRLPESIEKPKQATKEWADSLRDVSRAFAEIAQVSKGAMSTTFTLLAQLTTSASLAAESVKSISTGMDELSDGEGFKSNVEGWASITAGILGAVAAAIQFGKAIKDALIKSDAERAMEELGREWGVTIGKNLSEQIEETMKTKFKGMRNNRWLAEVFHLGDIIADVGGITIKNLPALQKQLRQAFVFLSEGAFDVSDVQHVLDTSFNQFVEFFTSRNKILSKELVEIIRLNHQMGVESKAVLDFVAQQSNRAGSALLQVFNQTGTAFAGLGQKIAAAEEAVAEARKKGSSSDIVKANAELTRLLTEQHRGAEQLGAEVTRLGGFILATFNAGIASGLSFQQALAGVQEPLKRLIDLQKDLGLDENNPALKALEVASQVASSQAGQAAAATNELILALSNIGALTFDTFKGVEEQLKDVYLRVQSEVAKAGGGTKEALQQILPSLQSIIDASKEYGFTIDANTQELIDQAVALGLLTGEAAEKIPDAAHGIQQMADVLLVGFGALIEAVGGELPAAFQTLRDKALQNLSDINAGVEGLPDGVTIPIDFPRGELPVVPPSDLPDHVDIPIDFPVPDRDLIPFPKFPDGIDIPVDFPRGELPVVPPSELPDNIEIPINVPIGDDFQTIQELMEEMRVELGLTQEELDAINADQWSEALEGVLVKMGLTTEQIDLFREAYEKATDPSLLHTMEQAFDQVGDAINDLPDSIEIPVEFPSDRIQIPEHPRSIKIPVEFPREALEIPGGRPPVQYAQGGPVYAAGGMFISRGTDTVPAMLTPGEFVMNRNAVNRIGSGTLDAWNRGDSQAPTPHVTYNYFTIQAWDGDDVIRTLKTNPKIKKAMGNASMEGVEYGGEAARRFDARVRRVK